MSSLLSFERLRSQLNYSESTGQFYWKTDKGRIKKGTLCNTISHGYILICIDKVRYKAHRLAWFYVHGSLPAGHIDHINGNKSDNRICNLRVCNDAQNGQNRTKANKNSKTGQLGVSFESGKWRAKIWLNRKQIHLGRFDSFDLAKEAYLSAKRKMHEFHVE